MQSYLVLAGIVLTFLTALVGWLSSRGNAKKLTKQTGQLAEVHVLVNSRLKTVVERVDQLVTTLQVAGVPVPDPPGTLTPPPPPAPAPGQPVHHHGGRNDGGEHD